MDTFTQLAALQAHLNTDKTPPVLIPTMGHLHPGHLSLIQLAATYSTLIVVSIYVNPTQFGVNEDFARYPKTLAADIQLLSALETKLKRTDDSLRISVWAPNDQIMYPLGLENSTQVSAPHLSQTLCGRSRPHHFTGVTTVVSKLFNQVRPQWAIFGEKDYQQLRIIEQLCIDMSYHIKIIPAPTAREEDGLALSSRNQFLTPQQRQIAPKLHQTLLNIARQLSHITDLSVDDCCVECQVILNAHKQQLQDHGFLVDYLAVKHRLLLEDPGPRCPLNHLPDWRIFGAVVLKQSKKTTRLIDNIPLDQG